MSNIRIERTHNLSPQEIRISIENIKQKLEKKLELRSEWETESLLTFRRKGASGKIIFDDSNFEFNLNLGIMFRMMKTSIQQEVSEVIDQYLN